MEEKREIHTPGPWENVEWNDEFRSVRVFSDARIVGFSANSDMAKEEIEANGRLMAAAPEMLEALTDIVSSIRSIDSRHPDLDIPGFLSREIEACEAIIKKARGLA